jgi:plasmid stability protein
MPTLTIRNLPEEVHRALRLRAAANGRSVEAEVRNVLAAAVATPPGAREERRDFETEDKLPSAIGLWGQSEPGRSEVDRLIAQRRVEAAYEGEEITAEEYIRLNERIDAWEIDADWIDRFMAQRRGEI